MANDLNRVMLIGRLTKDPDLRHTPSGASVVSFTLANNRSYTKNGSKNELASYFDCVAWNKLAEVVAEYCKKGQRVAVEGKLQQRSWDDQDGKKRSKVEVVVDNLQFLEGKGTGNFGGSEYSSSDSASSSSPEVDDNPFTDDDIPF